MKTFCVVSQEKVILQNFFALFQVYLRLLEVEFDVQALKPVKIMIT